MFLEPVYADKYNKFKVFMDAVEQELMFMYWNIYGMMEFFLFLPK